jgi:hypothetical protein
MRWFVATLGWIILLIILWIVIGKPLPGYGHEMYPPECCDGTDCEIVPCRDIKQLGEMKWQHGEALFGANNVRKPRDENCHVCKSKSIPRCIFFPMTSS